MRKRILSAKRRLLRQYGQVLLWTLATAAACVAVFLGVYGVGQANTEKQKIVNTADAAVYSAAMIEARSLNLEAYLNRSIVVHEVMIAQVASLDSWLFYMAKVGDNIGTILRFIPPAAAVGQALKQVANFIEQIANKFPQPLVTAEQLAVTVTTASREFVHASTYITAIDTANKVVQQNATNFNNHSDTAPYITKAGMAAMVKNEASWMRFTQKFVGDDRKNARDVILRSRDRFSGDNERRGGIVENFNIPLGMTGFEKTTGGTHLVGYDRWEAQDTMEWWTKVFKGKSYVPIGWGRATVSEQGERGNYWPANGSATRFAFKGTKKISGWKGIPEMRDVVDRKATYDPDVDGNKHRSLTFMIEVAKNRTDIPFASTQGMDKNPTGARVGSPDLNEQLLNDRIGATSKAVVYFKRPWLTADITARSFLRDDGAQEYGSLYNPYWQVRLSDVTMRDKEAFFYLGTSAQGQSIFTPDAWLP